MDAKHYGTSVVISAERDGDTVSPERGIYVVDLSQRVTRDELRERVKANLEAEQALVAKGKRLFGPIAADVKSVVSEVSVPRIYSTKRRSLISIQSLLRSRATSSRQRSCSIGINHSATNRSTSVSSTGCALANPARLRMSSRH